jgi:hypothetical protein
MTNWVRGTNEYVDQLDCSKPCEKGDPEQRVCGSLREIFKFLLRAKLFGTGTCLDPLLKTPLVPGLYLWLRMNDIGFRTKGFYHPLLTVEVDSDVWISEFVFDNF